MKVSNLKWFAVLSLFSGFAFSQDVYVSGNTKIKIEQNTLVYFGQNFELTENVTANSTVENAGSIKIDGSFKNDYTTSGGANFVSTWTNANNYGQVIINDNNSSANQPLAMQKGKINPADYSWGQFAIPFHFTNATQALQTLFGTQGYPNNGNRYKSPMMVWDNTSKPEFDHLLANNPINPTDYVIVNLVYSSAGVLPNMQGNMSVPLLYKGVPANEEHTNITLSPSIYPASSWSVWKEQINSHNERYKTYIDDKIRNIDSDNDYGKYYFQYGNPYTSNIDLTKITSGITNLYGVAQMGGAHWQDGQGQITQEMIKATYNDQSNEWVGDAEALIVKPFQPFLIVLKDTTPQTITFNDTAKTFSDTANAQVDSGKNTHNSSNNGVGEDNSGNSGNFYQLILRLYDTNGNTTGNRVVVAVTSNVENGIPNALEADYNDYDGTGFYLAQERADGGHVTTTTRKMDINTVNLDFVGKAIPLFFDRTQGDTNIYTVKAELFEGSIFNKLKTNNTNFSDGNSFFFYDNEIDELTEVKSGSEFQITPPSIYGARNRYEVYWNEGPSVRMDTNDQWTSATIIYKDGDSHFVKFNDKWTSAEVKVYDLSGRKILTFNDVDTKNRLEIKLPTRGVYAVKIVSNTREIYTQKIIK